MPDDWTDELNPYESPRDVGSMVVDRESGPWRGGCPRCGCRRLRFRRFYASGRGRCPDCRATLRWGYEDAWGACLRLLMGVVLLCSICLTPYLLIDVLARSFPTDWTVPIWPAAVICAWIVDVMVARRIGRLTVEE